MTHKRAFEAYFFVELLSVMLQTCGTSSAEKPAGAHPQDKNNSYDFIFIRPILSEHPHLKCLYLDKIRAVGLRLGMKLVLKTELAEFGTTRASRSRDRGSSQDQDAA